MKRIVILILILLVFMGCASEEYSRRQAVIDKLKELYPDNWQQKLVEYDQAVMKKDQDPERYTEIIRDILQNENLTWPQDQK